MSVIALVLAAQVATPPDRGGLEVAAELSRLRAQVFALEVALRSRDEKLDALAGEVQAARREILASAEEAGDMASPFLAGPPSGSDVAGVAKGAVFAPRVKIESTTFHDTLALRLRRVEPRGLRVVAEVEVPRDGNAVDLPIDRNGALYVVEWSTSEGHNFPLLLLDGASGLPAATVQVRPNVAEGRFLFVGYRTE